VWAELSNAYRNANAEGRISIVKLIEPIAHFQPGRALELVEFELQNPAKPVDHPFGIEVTSDTVKEELPELLRAIAYSPQYTKPSVEILWELGRDDPREPHSHPSHPVRVLKEIGSYQHPLKFADALLNLTIELVPPSGDHHRNPLELLQPLLARDGTTFHSEGYDIHSSTFFVNSSKTVGIRDRVRGLLQEQSSTGEEKTRYLAACLLGDGLREPQAYFGQEVPGEVRDAWLSDQEATMKVIEEVFTETKDPLVRIKLREEVRWHAEYGAWPTIRSRAQAVVDAPIDDLEAILTEIVDPWPFLLKDDEREKRLNAAVTPLVSMIPEKAPKFVETWLDRRSDAIGSACESHGKARTRRSGGSAHRSSTDAFGHIAERVSRRARRAP
jgi:hypothetical protein